MDHPHDRSSPVTWAERTQKPICQVYLTCDKIRRFAPFCPFSSLYAKYLTLGQYPINSSWTLFGPRNPYSLYFLIFTFYLLIEKKRVQGSKTPTFRCNSNVLGAMTQRVQKGSKRVHFSIFVGHCPCLRGQYPIKIVFWTLSGPPLPPFFGPRIWD